MDVARDATSMFWLTLVFAFAVTVGTTDENIAAGRPTKESSETYGKPASKAVDGDINGHMIQGSTCTKTIEHTDYPWWAVDLQSVRLVRSVHIYNRVDCCGKLLHDLQVGLMGTWPTAGGSTALAMDAKCASIAGSHPEARLVLQCEDNAVGRYLVIQITAIQSVVSLCEVEVFVDQDTATKVNIAVGLSVQLSSEVWNGEADHANDGDINGHFYIGESCAMTEQSDNPWWAVDLQTEHVVRSVRIYNRIDSNPENLHDVRVGLTDHWPTSGASSVVVVDAMCATAKGPHPEARLTIHCQKNAVGRYLVIQIDGANSVLAICEVEIFADPVVSNHSTKGAW